MTFRTVLWLKRRYFNDLDSGAILGRSVVSEDFVDECASLHVAREECQLLLKQCQRNQKLVTLAWENLYHKFSGTIVFPAKLKLLEDLQLDKSNDLEHLINVGAI